MSNDGLPAPRAPSALMMLEIKALVKRLPGNAYVRAGSEIAALPSFCQLVVGNHRFALYNTV